MSVEQKFQRYADYFDTLLQAQRQLAGSSDARINQKRAKILAHARLAKIYGTLDGVSDEE